ncbi:hypothetical protein T07_8878 [Trichinella nelsoni]|uniref:Uncharacterized protein n=1 Tax=Trichinella nelsoni TaxID=6336 RepID=A0A0V0RCM4_9BILA|nr:hypothetical protein T07_8878 [Trichinella nelsoni]
MNPLEISGGSTGEVIVNVEELDGSQVRDPVSEFQQMSAIDGDFKL